MLELQGCVSVSAEARRLFEGCSRPVKLVPGTNASVTEQCLRLYKKAADCRAGGGAGLWKTGQPLAAGCAEKVRRCFVLVGEVAGVALARAPEDEGNMEGFPKSIAGGPELGQTMLFVWTAAFPWKEERPQILSGFWRFATELERERPRSR